MPTVLLADDYVDNLEVLALYLQAEGFSVLTAADGLTALEQIELHLPDIVVMDLEMPELSGSAVARKIRAQTATAQVPLIAATGHTQRERIDEATEAGFDLVLVKPYDPDELVRHIRRLIGSRKASPA
jgi:chemosensory pili system protein ChpA (sensor histidine kinase/response regulator)